MPRDADLIRPDTAETELFDAIVRGEKTADPQWLQAGRDAHADGVAFHLGPRPFESVAALSWRIGWNDRALEQNYG